MWWIDVNWIWFFRVQLGYTAQLQGRMSEAQQLYQKVLKQKPTDVAVLALAANNSATINGAQNVFDSRRKLKLTKSTLDENDVKFTMKQKRALAINQCLFLGLTLQVLTILICLFEFEINNWTFWNEMFGIQTSIFQYLLTPDLFPRQQLTSEKNNVCFERSFTIDFKWIQMNWIQLL